VLHVMPSSRRQDRERFKVSLQVIVKIVLAAYTSRYLLIV
jgi:hypothetical protein